MNGVGTVLVAAVALIVGAGAASWAIRSSDQAMRPALASTDREGAAVLVPVGDAAGGRTLSFPEDLDNPLGHGPAVLARGHQLFNAMNCAGCHGYGGGGGMGPDLTDSYWRYGGTPVRIYKTLYEGRPQGMPAWGRALPPRDLWALAAFVGSLGGGVPAAEYQRGLQGDYHTTDTAHPDGTAARGGAGATDQ